MTRRVLGFFLFLSLLAPLAGAQTLAAPEAAPVPAFDPGVAPAPEPGLETLGRDVVLAAAPVEPPSGLEGPTLTGWDRHESRFAKFGPAPERSFFAETLGRLFDRRALGLQRHFDHPDESDDSFPRKDDGNPDIVADHIKPLLPSAYTQEHWTGRVNLHLHSVYSDGTMEPEAVMELAAKAGVRVLALSDHDTVAGVRRAYKKAKELGLEFHPAAELSAAGGAHIGAVDIDIFNKDLTALLSRVRELRWKKAEVLVGNLNALPELRKKKIVITIEEVAAKSKHAEGGTIELPHIARVLVDKGLVQHVDDAFNAYLKGPVFDGIEKYPDPPVEDVLAAIRSAGGKAILNHPYTLRPAGGDGEAEAKLAESRQEQLIEAALRKGFDGIEVYRPVHATSEEGKKRADDRAAKYLILADKYSKDGRIVVAAPGADYHGEDTHLRSKAVWMPKNLAAQLLDSLEEAAKAAIAALEAAEGAPPASAALRAADAPVPRPQPSLPLLLPRWVAFAAAAVALAGLLAVLARWL